MALTGTQIALRQQVSEDLEDGDILMTQMPFLGMLLGFDSILKTPGDRFKVGGPLSGEALQEDFRIGLPTTRGIDANTSNFNQLLAPLQAGMNVIGGTIVPSSFDLN